jgi:hypothetical protein
MRCNRIFQPAPSTSAAEIGFVPQKPASHSPPGASGIPLKLAPFGQYPKPLLLRHLTSQIGFVWEIAISPAQLASFRTARETDLPVCQPPAGKPALRAGSRSTRSVKGYGAGFQPAMPTFLSALWKRMSKLRGPIPRSVNPPLCHPTSCWNWLRFAQGPHATCHLLYLDLKA